MEPNKAVDTELSTAKLTGVVVSLAFSPVPGYLVALIKDRQLIDFTLLRPINLKQLPQREVPAAQLDKLLNSKLLPIRHFQDGGRHGLRMQVWLLSWHLIAYHP